MLSGVSLTPPCHRDIQGPIVTGVPMPLFGVVPFWGALVEVTRRLSAKNLREGKRERIEVWRREHGSV